MHQETTNLSTQNIPQVTKQDIPDIVQKTMPNKATPAQDQEGEREVHGDCSSRKGRKTEKRWENWALERMQKWKEGTNYPGTTEVEFQKEEECHQWRFRKPGRRYRTKYYVNSNYRTEFMVLS
jgi:hypothetical protein